MISLGVFDGIEDMYFSVCHGFVIVWGFVCNIFMVIGCLKTYLYVKFLYVMVL